MKSEYFNDIGEAVRYYNLVRQAYPKLKVTIYVVVESAGEVL